MSLYIRAPPPFKPPRRDALPSRPSVAVRASAVSRAIGLPATVKPIKPARGTTVVTQKNVYPPQLSIPTPLVVGPPLNEPGPYELGPLPVEVASPQGEAVPELDGLPPLPDEAPVEETQSRFYVTLGPEANKDQKSDFLWGKMLGFGTYAKVHLAKRKDETDKFSKKRWAVKMADKKLLFQHNRQHTLTVEYQSLWMLRDCPSVITLDFAFQDDDHVFFGLELAANGELGDYMKKIGKFSPALAQHFMAEMVLACENMHSRGLLHRDLKPANMLLDDRWHIRVTDFGTARIAGSKFQREDDTKDVSNDDTFGLRRGRTETFVGSPYYISPEMLIKKGVGPQADLWAIACILYQMLTAELPFKTHPDIKRRNITWPEDMDPKSKDLLDNMLILDPQLRIGGRGDAAGYAQIKAHPFFAGINWSEVLTLLPPIMSEPLSKSDPVPVAVPEPTQDDHVYEPSPSQPSRASTKWDFFCQKGEHVVFNGLVDKSNPRNPIPTKRHLILTDLPRLFYVDPIKMESKGGVPYFHKIQVIVNQRDARYFYVVTPQRKFKFGAHSTSGYAWKTEIEGVQLAAEERASSSNPRASQANKNLLPWDDDDT